MLLNFVQGAGWSITVCDHQVVYEYGAHLAFGHGPRACPGTDLAEIVTLVVISSVLQRFEISLAPGHAPLERKFLFTEVSDQDIRLVLQARDDYYHRRDKQKCMAIAHKVKNSLLEQRMPTSTAFLFCRITLM
jgi:hypothetical protein